MTAAIITAFLFGLATSPAIYLAYVMIARYRDLRLNAEQPDMHAMLRDACGDGCTIRREEPV